MNSLDFVFQILLALIGTFGGALGMWLINRKQSKATAIEAATNAYDNIAVKLEAQVQKLVLQLIASDKQIESLKLEVKDLKSQNESYTQEISSLTQEIRTLQSEVERLREDKKENSQLKKQIQKYETLLSKNNIVY